MSVLHLTSKAGPDGVVQFNTGVPGAEVEIVASVKSTPITDEQWKKEMRELLNSMGENFPVEALPRKPMKDPWSEE